MNYIVLDLEWNQSYRGKEYSIEEMPFEIIQIGAVKLDEHKNITGRWERIIRPVEYVKLHGKVSEMLEITEDELKMGDDFASAAKEKEASDLKKKYFGAEGDLYKMREALMGPIQEEIYNAVKEISDLRGYSLVIDRASNNGIIFGSPKIDISNEVLQKLGYSNK